MDNVTLQPHTLSPDISVEDNTTAACSAHTPAMDNSINGFEELGSSAIASDNSFHSDGIRTSGPVVNEEHFARIMGRLGFSESETKDIFAQAKNKGISLPCHIETVKVNYNGKISVEVHLASPIKNPTNFFDVKR